MLRATTKPNKLAAQPPKQINARSPTHLRFLELPKVGTPVYEAEGNRGFCSARAQPPPSPQLRPALLAKFFSFPRTPSNIKDCAERIHCLVKGSARGPLA